MMLQNILRNEKQQGSQKYISKRNLIYFWKIAKCYFIKLINKNIGMDNLAEILLLISIKHVTT